MTCFGGLFVVYLGMIIRENIKNIKHLLYPHNLGVFDNQKMKFGLLDDKGENIICVFRAYIWGCCDSELINVTFTCGGLKGKTFSMNWKTGYIEQIGRNFCFLKSIK